MKKIIAPSILMLISSYIYATVFIVDNNIPKRANTYNKIIEAHELAFNGDTIFLAPSETEYTGLTIYKKLHIIGVGWNHPSLSVANTQIGSIIFQAGSDGSTLESVFINGQIQIFANSITIAKNKINTIWISSNLLNILIKQNYIKGSNCHWGGWANLIDPLITIGNYCNIIFANNIVNNYCTGYNGTSLIYFGYPNAIILVNNLFIGTGTNSIGINMSTSGNGYCQNEVYNNIQIGNGNSGITKSYNNICDGSQLADTNQNILNVDKYSIFIDYDNENYHLKAPYLGGNYGIYEGDFPYIDGGYPGFPIIQKLENPLKVNKLEGLNVEIIVKTNN